MLPRPSPHVGRYGPSLRLPHHYAGVALYGCLIKIRRLLLPG
jgi:hypothetical protein